MSQAGGKDLTGTKDPGAVALRAAVRIMEQWSATSKQIQSVLRISRCTYSRAKDQRRPVEVDSDQLARASLVLNIHAALRTIFDNPDNVYDFPSMKNDDAFFGGRSPLDLMSEGSLIQLYETFRRIDVLCRARW